MGIKGENASVAGRGGGGKRKGGKRRTIIININMWTSQ